MAGTHADHALITREYAELGTIDDPTKTLHEAYPHEFVDDEFIETAISRGAFVAAPDSVVEHLHPHSGKAEVDELYSKAGRRMLIGRQIYRWRRRKWRKRAGDRQPGLASAACTLQLKSGRRGVDVAGGVGGDDLEGVGARA